jgi:CheY-like chemotaxis protein
MANPFDGLTALVVEDDGLLREDIAEFFRRQGWSVFETAIGAGALQMIREADRVHLLFTDINLADAVTDGMSRKPAGCLIQTLRSFMPQEGGRIMPASCLGVFFCPSLCRRMISC